MGRPFGALRTACSFYMMTRTQCDRAAPRMTDQLGSIWTCQLAPFGLSWEQSLKGRQPACSCEEWLRDAMQLTYGQPEPTCAVQCPL